MLYKSKFRENRKDWVFLLLVAILLFARVIKLKYFLIIAPILIIFFSKNLSLKQIKWNCILSVILIGFLTYGFFGHNADFNVQKEITNISQNYNVSYIIAGPYEAPLLATFLWQNEPYIVWYEDFQASLKNETLLKSYNLNFNSKIRLRDKLGISVDFERPENIVYSDYIVVAKKEDKIEGFKAQECYDALCVYESV